MSEKHRTMSVRKMRTLLGISKTDSYWLLHKGFFETTTVSNRIRIYTDSFEEWYKNQSRYKKVNGPPPELLQRYPMTIQSFADELGIARSTAYDIICVMKQLPHIRVDGAVRISRMAFERWYSHQCRYHKVVGEPPGQSYPESLSPHDVCDLLGIPLRNTGYTLFQKGFFVTFKEHGRLRIEKKSFDRWYRQQTLYKKKAGKGETDYGIYCEEEE